MENFTLNFTLNNKENSINISENEFKLFTPELKYVDLNDNHKIKINPNFFNEKNKVKNVWRYKLKYKALKWEFTYPNDSNLAKEFTIKNDVKLENENQLKKNNIVLILESPHKDEYEDGHITRPKSPASGNTGKYLENYFCSHVLPILFNLGLDLNKNDNYNFYIVNPVPYQTSLYNILDKKWTKGLRNKLWKHIYNTTNTNKSIKNVLDKYKPYAIINGCTSDLKKHKPFVNDLVEINNSQIYNISHPCSWQSTFGAFKNHK